MASRTFDPPALKRDALTGLRYTPKKYIMSKSFSKLFFNLDALCPAFGRDAHFATESKIPANMATALNPEKRVLQIKALFCYCPNVLQKKMLYPAGQIKGCTNTLA
jgi:hypothetical protein